MWFAIPFVYAALGLAAAKIHQWNNEPAVPNIQTGTTIPWSDKRDIKRIINGTYKFPETYALPTRSEFIKR